MCLGYVCVKSTFRTRQIFRWGRLFGRCREKSRYLAGFFDIYVKKNDLHDESAHESVAFKKQKLLDESQIIEKPN